MNYGVQSCIRSVVNEVGEAKKRDLFDIRSAAGFTTTIAPDPAPPFINHEKIFRFRQKVQCL